MVPVKPAGGVPVMTPPVTPPAPSGVVAKAEAHRRRALPIRQRRRVDQVGGRGLIVGKGGDERQEQRHRLVLSRRGIEQSGLGDLRDHRRARG